MWTHLLPVFLFVALGCVTLFRDLPAWSTHGMHLPGAAELDRLFVPSASTADYLLLALFYLSAISCFAWSAAYHLFGCVSYDTHQCLYRCDIGGILFLILGSYLPALHFAFSCRPLLQWLYCGVISFLVLSLLVSFNVPRCSSRRWHCLRVAALIATIAFAVLPTGHWLLVVRPADYPHLSLSTYLLPLLLMLACYAAGFGFYASRWPERSAEGRFDLVLSSHNIWHVWIVCAALVWEGELKRMFGRTSIAQCT